MAVVSGPDDWSRDANSRLLESAVLKQVFAFFYQLDEASHEDFDTSFSWERLTPFAQMFINLPIDKGSECMEVVVDGALHRNWTMLATSASNFCGLLLHSPQIL